MSDTELVRSLRTMLDVQTRHAMKLEEHVDRLEAAGDAMASHAKALGMEGTGLVKRWKEAKEDRP